MRSRSVGLAVRALQTDEREQLRELIGEHAAKLVEAAFERHEQLRLLSELVAAAKPDAQEALRASDALIAALSPITLRRALLLELLSIIEIQRGLERLRPRLSFLARKGKRGPEARGLYERQFARSVAEILSHAGKPVSTNRKSLLTKVLQLVLRRQDPRDLVRDAAAALRRKRGQSGTG